MIVGRLIALAINFIAQIALVRYLSRDDYGTFANVFAIISILQVLVAFGMPETVARSISISRERGEYGRIAGILAVAGLTVVGVGLSVILLTFLADDPLSRILVEDNQADASQLLLILILLVPVESLNQLFTNLFASFSRPSAIFWRRFVLAPLLKLLAVAILMLGSFGIIAYGWLLLTAGALGLLLNIIFFSQVLASEGYLDHFRSATPVWPVRELLGFAIPVLTSSMIWLLMEFGSAVLLGWLSVASEVAAYQASIQVARLNQILLLSMATLFTPVAARLFARHDHQAIDQLYWQTARVIFVLNLPVLLMTSAFAPQTVALLFGQQYADAAAVMAILALGYAVNNLTGYNNALLQTYRQLRYAVITDLGTLIASLGLSLLLIPRYGAVGAALATSLTQVLLNLVRQFGMQRRVGIGGFAPEYVRMFVLFMLLTSGLALLGWLLPVPAPVCIVIALLASGVVWHLDRRRLQLETLFPELLRFSLARSILQPFLSG